MRKCGAIFVVDMRDAGWQKQLAPELGSAIGQLAARRREGLMVLADEPTVGQACRHTLSALAVLARALGRTLHDYCARVNRGFVVCNYQYLLEARKNHGQ